MTIFTTLLIAAKTAVVASTLGASAPQPVVGTMTPAVNAARAVGEAQECETAWAENLGYPTSDGPWVEMCGDANGNPIGQFDPDCNGVCEPEPTAAPVIDATPAAQPCDELAALHYAMAESAGVWGDPAYEDAFASCNTEAR